MATQKSTATQKSVEAWRAHKVERMRFALRTVSGAVTGHRSAGWNSPTLPQGSEPEEADLADLKARLFEIESELEARISRIRFVAPVAA